MTPKAIQEEFDSMMKQATELMFRAMELKEADLMFVNVSVKGRKAEVNLHWDAKEYEGKMQPDGTFSLERR